MATKLQGSERDTLIEYDSEAGEKIKVMSGILKGVFSTRIYIGREKVKEFFENEFSEEDIPLLIRNLESLAESHADSEELSIDMEQYCNHLKMHRFYKGDDKQYTIEL